MKEIMIEDWNTRTIGYVDCEFGDLIDWVGDEMKGYVTRMIERGKTQISFQGVKSFCDSEIEKNGFELMLENKFSELELTNAFYDLEYR